LLHLASLRGLEPPARAIPFSLPLSLSLVFFFSLSLSPSFFLCLSLFFFLSLPLPLASVFSLPLSLYNEVTCQLNLARPLGLLRRPPPQSPHPHEPVGIPRRHGAEHVCEHVISVPVFNPKSRIPDIEPKAPMAPTPIPQRARPGLWPTHRAPSPLPHPPATASRYPCLWLTGVPRS